MKFKFAVASYEVLISDRLSQLRLAAEVKDYFRSSELNLLMCSIPMFLSSSLCA